MAFHSSRFEAIGVSNQVTVTDAAALAAASAIAREQVAALDVACSRFRNDSEILALNRADRRGLEVSGLLLDLVETALAAARWTDGLVDPTVAPAMRGLGYDADFEVLVRRVARPTFELVRAGGWRSVHLDRASGVIGLAPGCELDLGATAKAFAAERIARAARAATGSDVLVSLGGDIAVAGAPPGGWPIHVGEDHRRAHGGQTVAIHAGALATSSTTVRRWMAGGRQMHHIVDPASGAPAAVFWRTASVTAASCVQANAASTAAILLGERAGEWLSSRGLAARLVHSDGHIELVGGWPAEPANAASTGSTSSRSDGPMPGAPSGAQPRHRSHQHA